MRISRGLRRPTPPLRAVAVLSLAGLGLGACTEAESRNAPEDSARGPDMPAADVRTVSAGSILRFSVDRTVSTDTDAVGTEFTASLVSPVFDDEGVEAIPAGTASRWIVTESSTEDGRSVLAFRLASIRIDGSWMDADATITDATLDTDDPDSDRETAAKIGIGAAAGAIVGQILGRDTESTLVGAGVGAAVGTAVALSTRDGHATLPAGSTLEVETNEAIQIR